VAVVAGSVTTLVVVGTASAAPKTLTVCASGCGYSNINAAIKASATGDTVVVKAGTYRQSVLVNKAITLQGSGTVILAGEQVGQRGQVQVQPSKNGPIVVSDLQVQGTGAIAAGRTRYGITVTRPDPGTKAVSFTRVKVIDSVTTTPPHRDYSFWAQGTTDAQDPALTLTDVLVQPSRGEGVLLEDWRGPVTVTRGTYLAGYGEDGDTTRPFYVTYLGPGRSTIGAFTLTAAKVDRFETAGPAGNAAHPITFRDYGLDDANQLARLVFGDPSADVTIDHSRINGVLQGGRTFTSVTSMGRSMTITNSVLYNLAQVFVDHGTVKMRNTALVGGANSTRDSASLPSVAGGPTLTADVAGNWWNCAAGPDTAGNSERCAGASAGAKTVPYLVPRLKTSATSVLPGKTIDLTFDLTTWNTGAVADFVNTIWTPAVTAVPTAGTITPVSQNGRTFTFRYTAPTQPGRYQIAFRVDTWPSLTTDVTVAANPNATKLVSGLLQSDRGGPAAGVKVYLNSLAGAPDRSATSDANGNYSFANVPDGDYLLYFSDPQFVNEYAGDTRNSANATVFEMRNGASITYDRTMRSAMSVYGTVTNSDRTPAANAVVTFVDMASGKTVLTLRTDAAGNFLWTEQPVFVPTTLVVTSADGKHQWRLANSSGTAQPVTGYVWPQTIILP
jgi:hypothetical protein